MRVVCYPMLTHLVSLGMRDRGLKDGRYPRTWTSRSLAAASTVVWRFVHRFLDMDMRLLMGWWLGWKSWGRGGSRT